MDDGTLQRVIVLSDLHLGDEGAILTDRDHAYSLVDELRELRPVDLLVLLGDVWDLWRTDLHEASLAATHFFQALAAWSDHPYIVLIPGNHDNHLMTFSEEKRRMLEVGWEEKDVRLFMWLQAEKDFRLGLGRPPAWLDDEEDEKKETCHVEGLTLDMRYPYVSLEVRNREVFITHGHHLDFFSSHFWWFKTSVLARLFLGKAKKIAFKDIDRMNKPFFEFLAYTARVPEMVDKEYRFYRLIRRIASLLRLKPAHGAASPRRGTSVERNVKEAQRLLTTLRPGYVPDLFVFGHTHDEGKTTGKVGEREFLLANCGCFFNETGKEKTPGTYLVIDDEVRLCHLGG